MKTAITLVAVAAVLAAVLWFGTNQFGPVTPARGTGIALAIIGFLLWAMARIELGRSFSVRAKATELVTRGLYSKIRNPVYVFGTVFIMGMILWAGRLVWLLVLVIIVPMQIVRARKEAQVLEAQFGDAYRAYRSRTWF
jgi:protein-S-isoprenylcysteine O-methyltransferase Ste14